MEASKRVSVVIGLALVLAACGQDTPEERATPELEPAASDSGAAGMQGMAGMEGMSGMMGSEMMAQMQSMQGMPRDSMMKMVPAHTRMLDSLITTMDREMKAAGKPANPAHMALVDSLHADMARMPTMSMAEMQDLMAAHHARVARLMEMHRSMMGGS